MVVEALIMESALMRELTDLDVPRTDRRSSRTLQKPSQRGIPLDLPLRRRPYELEAIETTLCRYYLSTNVAIRQHFFIGGLRFAGPTQNVILKLCKLFVIKIGSWTQVERLNTNIAMYLIGGERTVK